jgi:hypothetical protein
LSAEYLCPGLPEKLYQRWISYCRRNGWEITYLDVTSREIKVIRENEAIKLIGADASPVLASPAAESDKQRS